MSSIEGTLCIELRSDLCAGSGDGFSSGIDTDVCYDDKGRPVIPARRIKGCLREAARVMGHQHEVEGRLRDDDDMMALFGRAGSSEPGSLVIHDAVVVQQFGEGSGDVQQTLDKYAYVRAQTMINEKTGSAEPNTLRFTRVVKQYVPTPTGDGFEPLRFHANVWADESHKELLTESAAAMRSIGLARNRGFGAIRCSIAWDNAPNAEGDVEGCIVERQFVEEVGEEEVSMTSLSYAVRLETSLMFPRDNGNRSADAIPGSAVLGFFASKLKDSPQFDELFLSGRARFSPLYPVSHDGVRCMPAPAFIARIKGGSDDGVLKNVFDLSGDEIAKPLKDGYVDSSWNKVDAMTQTVYHHSREGEGTLYTQECLCTGQLMGGFIECPTSLADEVRGVLADRFLYFGRSRTAQYARTSLAKAPVDYACSGDRITLRQGKYALVLDSDVLLLNAEGSYATGFEDLVRALKRVLGEQAMARIDVWSNATTFGSGIRRRVVSGFNAKWNQKKPHVLAFAAGSCVVFDVDKDVAGVEVPAVYYVGERQAEGFGRVVLVSVDQAVPTNILKSGDAVTHKQATITSEEAARMAVVELYDSMRPQLAKLSSSFIGRIALMVRESADEVSFDQRLECIKDRDKRSAAQELRNKVLQTVGDDFANDWAIKRECLMLFLALVKYACRSSKASSDKEGE